MEKTISTEVEVWRRISPNRTYQPALNGWWKAVPVYEVSNLGRVRRVKVSRHGGYYYLKPRPLHSGYLRVSLAPKSDNYIHRLVLHAFAGPPPSPNAEAAHLNGDKSDNRAVNLIWCTHQENLGHKKKHGTAPEGARNGAAKLTETNVREIKARLKTGETYPSIAFDFEVSAGAIGLISRGERWAHIK